MVPKCSYLKIRGQFYPVKKYCGIARQLELEKVTLKTTCETSCKIKRALLPGGGGLPYERDRDPHW